MGTDIHYAGSSIGSSIKQEVAGKKLSDVDLDLIDQCDHDLKQLSKGIQYLVKQNDRIVTKYWPHLFLASIKTTKVLFSLLGENSLNFENIDEYYEKFDEIQANTESFLVHPKEKQFSIPSLLEELRNYLSTVTQTLERFKYLSKVHANRVLSKVDPLLIQIKHIRQAIAAKNKQKAKCDKLQWRRDKLAKKSVKIDKEAQEFDQLERKLGIENDVYYNIQTRLRSVIPESLSLIEEFVEQLTSWFIFHQHQLYEEIKMALKHFSTFHGFVSQFAGKNDKMILEYDEIIEEWEVQATPVRLRAESFLRVIYDRDPRRIDEDIDDKEHMLLMSKTWSSVKNKVTTKLHKVSAIDNKIGVFGEHVVADPLVLFKKYYNTLINMSEVYHPSRTLTKKDLVVEPQETSRPPPLPPRDESHRINLWQLQGTDSPAAFPRVDFHRISEDADESITEDLLSLKSELESETGALSTELTESDCGIAERILISIYNSRKNDITRAPETHKGWQDLKPVKEEKSSISRELMRLHEFFEEAIKQADERGEKKVAVATDSFDGEQPGDLSFREGDTVEVILDLQLLGATSNTDGKNWFVGMRRKRIGFAPNTHFSRT